MDLVEILRRQSEPFRMELIQRIVGIDKGQEPDRDKAVVYESADQEQVFQIGQLHFVAPNAVVRFQRASWVL